MPPARKPWPMRWIFASILLFIVPYTYVNLKFRKPEKAFEPYADMRDQANVQRLLAAGYTRVSVRAERPQPPLEAARLLPPAQLGAVIEAAPAGLPPPLDSTLVEPPRLPAGYSDLLVAAELAHAEPLRLQFTARLDRDREQLSGASVFLREDQVVLVPEFEPVPGELRPRRRDDTVLLTLPAGLLAPGTHTFTLAGAEGSLRWTVLVR